MAVSLQPSRETAGGPTFFFCGWPEFLTRFRLLITSVLSDIGRGRPWSFRNSPQALQSTDPASSRRHSGVVEVVQFWQTGCAGISQTATRGGANKKPTGVDPAAAVAPGDEVAAKVIVNPPPFNLQDR